jgi:hypothetical protein
LQSGESRRVLRVAVLCVVALMVGAGFGRDTGVVQAQKSLDQTNEKNQDPMLQKNQDPMMPSTVRPGAMPSDDSDIPGDAMRARLREDRLKALNDDRQRRLEDYVNTMMELTGEQKSDVDKTNKDELSLDVMRKAAEIEKLAHDVQSRMKN